MAAMYLCHVIEAHKRTSTHTAHSFQASSSTLIDRTMIRICRTHIYCRYHELGHSKSASWTGISPPWSQLRNSRWIGPDLFWWNRQYTGSSTDTCKQLELITPTRRQQRSVQIHLVRQCTHTHIAHFPTHNWIRARSRWLAGDKRP